jgi:CBS domain-containing protein
MLFNRERIQCRFQFLGHFGLSGLARVKLSLRLIELTQPSVELGIARDFPQSLRKIVLSIASMNLDQASQETDPEEMVPLGYRNSEVRDELGSSIVIVGCRLGVFPMATDLVTAPAGTTLAEANEVLRQSKKGKLPIIDADGNIVSLLSHSDLMKNLHYSLASKLPDSKQLICAAMEIFLKWVFDAYGDMNPT